MGYLKPQIKAILKQVARKKKKWAMKFINNFFFQSCFPKKLKALKNLFNTPLINNPLNSILMFLRIILGQ